MILTPWLHQEAGVPGGAITGILHYREKVKRKTTIGEEDITSCCVAVLQEKMYLHLFLCLILSPSYFTGQHSSHSSTPIHPPSTPIAPQPPTPHQLQQPTPLSPSYQVHISTIPSHTIVPHDPQGKTKLLIYPKSSIYQKCRSS